MTTSRNLKDVTLGAAAAAVLALTTTTMGAAAIPAPSGPASSTSPVETFSELRNSTEIARLLPGFAAWSDAKAVALFGQEAFLTTPESDQ